MIEILQKLDFSNLSVSIPNLPRYWLHLADLYQYDSRQYRNSKIIFQLSVIKKIISLILFGKSLYIYKRKNAEGNLHTSTRGLLETSKIDTQNFNIISDRSHAFDNEKKIKFRIKFYDFIKILLVTNKNSIYLYEVYIDMLYKIYSYQVISVMQISRNNITLDIGLKISLFIGINNYPIDWHVMTPLGVEERWLNLLPKTNKITPIVKTEYMKNRLNRLLENNIFSCIKFINVNKIKFPVLPKKDNLKLLIVGTWAHAENKAFDSEYIKTLSEIVYFCNTMAIEVEYKPHPNSRKKLEKKIKNLMHGHKVNIQENKIIDALENKTHAIHFGSLAIKEILLKNVVPIYWVNSILSWWINYQPQDFIIENKIGHIVDYGNISEVLIKDNFNNIWLERLQDSYGI